MAFLSSMDITASGLTAQQLRLDVISENITNSQTTRTENGGGAYRRKMTVFQAVSGRNSFREAMARANAGLASNAGYESAGGVQVTQIVEDPTDLKLVYDPTHPDANEDGYVEMPNVDMVKEMTDAMAASQAYSANVTAFNTLKSVVAKGMEIGK
jgi:flagellar basal-body rod protein FlgC